MYFRIKSEIARMKKGGEGRAAVVARGLGTRVSVTGDAIAGKLHEGSS